jgi:hypothetical protein
MHVHCPCGWCTQPADLKVRSAASDSLPLIRPATPDGIEWQFYILLTGPMWGEKEKEF